MDGQQRKKYATQTLRDMQDPEKVHILRTLVGCQETEKEANPVRPESTKEKLGALWSSTAGWSVIGVLVGAFVSQLSLKLLLVGVWGVLFFEALRVCFFKTRWGIIAGDSAIAVILAAVLFGFWKIAPKPKEPTTLDQQLEAIATKFPWLGKPVPTPVINIPSLPQHTHVSYESPLDLGRRLGLPDLVLKEKSAPSIQIGFKNGGDFPVQEPSDSGVVKLVPVLEIKTAFAKTRKTLKFMSPSGTLVSRDDLGAYHTFTGPILTNEDAQKIALGKLALCGFGAVRWKDASGRYETDFAQCAMADSNNGTTAIWHNVKENNEEHKID